MKSPGLHLPAVFSDHLLLQAGKPARIWGWDRPGTLVRVSLAKQAAQARADRGGRWEASLPPLKPGGPHVLVVEGSSTRCLQDVLVGELWLCSGQSNMEWPLKETERYKQDRASFRDPKVRLFHVPRKVSQSPQADVQARWEPLSPDMADNFSAVALYFAQKLRHELGVPVGLIGSYWGGTPIQAWTSLPTLRADRSNRPYLLRSAKAKRDLPAGPFELEIAELAWERADGKLQPIQLHKASLTIDHPNSKAVWKPQRQGGRLKGQLYHGGWVSVSRRLGTPASPFDASASTGLRLRARGKGSFIAVLPSAPITDWANHRTPFTQLTPRWKELRLPFSGLIKPWGDPQPFDPSKLLALNFELGDPLQPSQPAWLYNAMLAPLAPLALAGALWYQGESNVEQAQLYARQLRAMARDWRRSFREPKLPLLVVQLASFTAPPDRPGASLWAELRESQLKFLRDPHSGLAVTVDIGDPRDIHPRNKREVGRRLALEALAKVYGRKILSQGPLFASLRVKGRVARLHFKPSPSPLAARQGQALSGFLVAGADRRFYSAQAVLRGKEVWVSSPAVAEPKAVRYAWSDNPDQSLKNRAGLPASPFRTDQWPVLSTGKR